MGGAEASRRRCLTSPADAESQLSLTRSIGRWRLCCISRGASEGLTWQLWRDGTLDGFAAAGLLARFARPRANASGIALHTSEPVVPLATCEWCGQMWRSAALCVARLLSELSRRGLTLTSVRPENVAVAAGCRAVFARPGAFVAAAGRPLPALLRQLADFVILPLYICATGRSSTLRALLAGGDALSPARAFPELAEAARLACEPGGRPTAQVYEELARQIEGVAIPMSDTFWSGYYTRDVPLERSGPWPYKNHAVERILDSMDPHDVLDLACNTGWYTRLAATRGKRVVAVDADETCINRLFKVAGESALNVVPVAGDVLAPASLSLAAPWCSLPARARFASELVLALAFTHHMAFSPPWLSLEQVADLLHDYTSNYLLTEFVSFAPESRNPYAPDVRPGCESWYKLENFLGALRRRFREVTLVPGPAGRRLVLAEA